MGKNKKKGGKARNHALPATENSHIAASDEHDQEDHQSKMDERAHPPEAVQKAPENIKPSSSSLNSENVTDNSADEEIQILQGKINSLKLELTEEKAANEELRSKLDRSEHEYLESQEFKDLKAERDEFETQYNNLLSRIASMKNVFSKMKESQEELETVRDQLSEFESQNIRLKNKLDLLNRERTEADKTISTLNRELETLDEERESLQISCTTYKDELEVLKEQMENSSDDHLLELDAIRAEKLQLNTQLKDLMVILDNNKQDIAELREEKSGLITTNQNTLKEKEALRESINELETELEMANNRFKQDSQQRLLEINALRAQLDKSLESQTELSNTVEQLRAQVESMKEDVALKSKLEQECKERVLQIGKLRHEAIILNEHLTKALTMLKQSSDSESVDKELISNLLISFVAIPRADPKKFEVLELISSFLNWDDDKKRQAGLLHNNERASKSAGSNSSTENFVSLWTEFLEKESEK